MDAPTPDELPLLFRSGRSDPIRLADEPGTWVEVEVAASPQRLWELVTDVDLPARFSPEFLGAHWVDGAGPAVGATFVGRSQHPRVGEWEVLSFVEVCDPPRSFGWATVDASNPGSRWRFDLEPSGGATRLRFTLTLGPGPSGLTPAIAAMPDKEPRILLRRLAEHRENMRRTVEGIAALAEAPA